LKKATQKLFCSPPGDLITIAAPGDGGKPRPRAVIAGETIQHRTATLLKQQRVTRHCLQP